MQSIEFPIEIVQIINEYSKPYTRSDWRQGCYLNRFKYKLCPNDECLRTASFSKALDVYHYLYYNALLGSDSDYDSNESLILTIVVVLKKINRIR